MMSAIKANGFLKAFLRNATYEESLARIRSVARHQDQEARNVLMRCRRDHFKVGEQVRSSIKLAKIAAIKMVSSRKITMTRMCIRFKQAQKLVLTVVFNSIRPYIGKEGNIP